jgi:hypothetical protein
MSSYFLRNSLTANHLRHGFLSVFPFRLLLEAVGYGLGSTLKLRDCTRDCFQNKIDDPGAFQPAGVALPILRSSRIAISAPAAEVLEVLWGQCHSRELSYSLATFFTKQAFRPMAIPFILHEIS